MFVYIAPSIWHKGVKVYLIHYDVKQSYAVVVFSVSEELLKNCSAFEWSIIFWQDFMYTPVYVAPSGLHEDISIYRGISTLLYF